MTIKSLTITENAYEALKRLKYGNESFSEVILRLSKEKVGYAAKFFGVLKFPNKDIKELKGRIRKRRIEIEKEINERAKIIRKRLQ